MKTITLGKTGLQIAPIGFGGIPIQRITAEDTVKLFDLMIEKGITNLCNYDTPAGALVLDINGVEVESNLGEKGGEIRLAYTLNSSGLLISENNIKMKIKEL